jgi:hypothetical protein
MILHQIYKHQHITPVVEKYSRYESPISRVEQERKLFRSQKITDQISINTTIMTDQASISGSISAFDNIGDPNNSRISIDKNFDYEQQKKRITLTKIIQSIQLALLFDSNHLPARIFLGMIYYEKGDLPQAEHHLQLSCTCSRHRGSSSGRSGVSSCFGGSTSIWGWYGWHLLSLIFEEQGRDGDSKRAGAYALEFEKVCCLRGYECLVRF